VSPKTKAFVTAELGSNAGQVDVFGDVFSSHCSVIATDLVVKIDETLITTDPGMHATSAQVDRKTTTDWPSAAQVGRTCLP
jgi:hypothetical protein